VGKALLVVALFAVLVYAGFRLVDVRRRRRRPGPPTRPQRRALGPDDDPDFLRDLEQRRRREQREGRKDEPETG
jgi:hypothetical protein